MSLRPNSRTDVRKKSYKIGVDADEARRRREDNLVEIRKSKREDNLLKKRREGMLLQSQPQPIINDASQNIEKKVKVSVLIVPLKSGSIGSCLDRLIRVDLWVLDDEGMEVKVLTLAFDSIHCHGLKLVELDYMVQEIGIVHGHGYGSIDGSPAMYKSFACAA
uniref:IBB domain-containing protein n=1 Tax=Opuntia streptacantha TaxID=393608 RepID=A0A7C9D8L5_OPUST